MTFAKLMAMAVCFHIGGDFARLARVECEAGNVLGVTFHALVVLLIIYVILAIYHAEFSK